MNKRSDQRAELRQAEAGPSARARHDNRVEPMIKIAGAAIRTLGDKWTVVTQDGSLLAQFEHTVAIGENGDSRIVTT